MKNASVVLRSVLLALAGYILGLIVLAIALAFVVRLNGRTHGTIIVPVYIALHVLLRLSVFFLLGSKVVQRSAQPTMWTAAASGSLLAVVLMAGETAMRSIFTANAVLPRSVYALLLPVTAIGMSVLGGWIAARRTERTDKGGGPEQ